MFGLTGPEGGFISTTVHYDNPELQELITTPARRSTKQKRDRALPADPQMFIDDAIYIPLIQPSRVFVGGPQIKESHFHPTRHHALRALELLGRRVDDAWRPRRSDARPECPDSHAETGCSSPRISISPDGEGPWPAVLTYFPYHKDGTGGMGLSTEHRYFASHGFACLTLDVRGTGSSGGSVGLAQPTTSQRWVRRDGVDRGPTLVQRRGRVVGLSYGGATPSMVAATNPPHLRAIVPIHGSADEYDGFFRPHGCRPVSGPRPTGARRWSP